ncbi:thiol-disulfide isomerase/thioredoxin [Salibacterium salarium]|uniref:Thioredoxin n=1 Tax=Salibacterium salarium TaxID=284579 RepID=A0A428N794_9BACI|nr:thioredoxin family protein [Salibacterium salarium]MDQ0298529.1 thiol-disulfide isomerase/thioredoxin [Salibacterium salarium]RSL34239.1 thioredoxin [Salibacterium salarium]
MQDITERAQFDKVISNEKAVVMFSADWCPDCRVIEPALPELEEENKSFSFYHADRDQLIDVCQDYDIFGIPSFLVFENGEEIHRYVDKDRKTPEQVQAFLDEANQKISS